MLIVLFLLSFLICVVRTSSHFSLHGFYFSYLIENDVCYLVMCDKMYSKRLAFNYLEDLAQEFHANYGRRVNSVTRPYAFIEFDVYIQKAKKQLTDRRRNINAINTQLQDVQRIMVRNSSKSCDWKIKIIIFNVGAKYWWCTAKRHGVVRLVIYISFSLILYFTNSFCFFTELDTKTQNLSMMSQKYKKDATYLNRKSMYLKLGAAGVAIVVFILYFWVL